MFLSANRQLSCVKDRVCLPVRGCCFICMNKGEGYFVIRKFESTLSLIRWR